MKKHKQTLAALLAAVFLASLSSAGADFAQAAAGRLGALTTAAEAIARGKELFLSAYLDAPADPLSVTAVEAEDGWRVEAALGEAQLALLLSRDGQMIQYDNSAWPLPPLTNDAPSVEGVEEIAYAMDVSIAVDDMFRALIGAGFDAVCCYAVDEAKSVCYYRFNETQSFAAIQLEPALRLLAFSDLSARDARYGSYLSCREAEGQARAALAEAFYLSPAEASGLTLRQWDFAVNAERWAEAEVPTLYWFLVLNENADFSGGDYTALIDAVTGETLELHDPSTAGKG